MLKKTELPANYMAYANSELAKAKCITRVDDGLGEPFLMIGDVPLGVAAKEIWRGAIRCFKPVPTVLGKMHTGSVTA